MPRPPLVSVSVVAPFDGCLSPFIRVLDDIMEALRPKVQSLINVLRHMHRPLNVLTLLLTPMLLTRTVRFPIAYRIAKSLDPFGRGDGTQGIGSATVGACGSHQSCYQKRPNTEVIAVTLKT